jgi:hypothetical protein
MPPALLALSLAIGIGVPPTSAAQDFCGSIRRAAAVGLMPSNATAEEILKDLTEVAGVTTWNFVLLSVRDPELVARGAAAQICNEVQRYIFYDPDFVQRIRVQGGNDWPRYFTFAHEVAHHVNGDTLLNRAVEDVELAADRFAVKVLARRGASLPQILAAINSLGLSDVPKPGYPTRCARRREAMTAYDAVARETNERGGTMRRYVPCGDCDAVEPGGGLYLNADLAVAAPISPVNVMRCGVPAGADQPTELTRDVSGMCAASPLQAGDRLTWLRIGVCSLIRR